MGGEENYAWTGSAWDAGLPPRGRGREVSAMANYPWMRITPAWAGKRMSENCNRKTHRDYPRVGGEESTRRSVPRATGGLPPRGRGRERPHHAHLHVPGITPAWAGKSQSLDIWHLAQEDYPRVGGEESVLRSTVTRSPGLPPRGRGRDERMARGGSRYRITPAWAGKRNGTTPSGSALRDYPRVGGEEALSIYP